MWKKLGVAIVAFIASFSVIYAMNGEFYAASSPTDAPMSAYGRIQLQKGDRFISDTNAMEWLTIEQTEYTNYNLPGTCTVTGTNDCTNPELSSILAGTYAPIGTSYMGIAPTDFNNFSQGGKGEGYYVKSQVASKISTLNSNMSNVDKILVNARSLAREKTAMKGGAGGGDTSILKARLIAGAINVTAETGANFFTIAADVTSPGLTQAELSLPNGYWSSTFYNDSSGYKNTAFVLLPNDPWWETKANSATDKTIIRDVRPFAYFNNKKIAFGVSQGNGTVSNQDLTTIKNFVLPSTPSLYDAAKSGEPLKLRYIDDALATSTTFNHIEDSRGDIVTSASNDCSGQTCKIYIDASATAGSNAQGTYTVSALIFNQTGDFLYYKPMESAKGTGKYELDISNLPVGDYEIAIVNEAYDSTKMTPASSSGLTQKKPLKIVEPLKDLNHTQIHASSSSDYYVTGTAGNVKSQDKIASISTKDGLGGEIINGVFENGITFKLQPSQDSSHTNDYLSFEIPYLNGKPVLDGNSPYVIAKPTSTAYLNAGIYKYRIQAYDKNGSPASAQLNDGTLVTGITPNQGLITTDQTIVVYPHDSQLDFIQEKKQPSNVLYTKAELKALATGTLLATSTFDNDANISALQADGYSIDSIKLLEHGKTNELKELEAQLTVGNPNEFQIKKRNGANFTTDIEFDIVATFKHNGTDTAVLKKMKQKFEVPAGLSFVNPDTSKFLNPNEYTYTYDPANPNEFVLMATDNALPNVANTKVNYCILDSSNVCTSNSSVIAFVNGANPGTQKVEVKAPGTTDKTVNVRATIEDGSGNIVMSSDLKITIHPAKQVLTWEGTNIQSTGNNIDKDSVKHNTWNLNLKYDKDPAASNRHTSAEIISGVNATDTVITLRDDVVSGTAPKINYTYSFSPGDNSNNVIIKNNQLIISGELKGPVTITAQADAVGDYHESKGDDASTPAVNEDEKAYLVLTVSSKAKVKFTPSYVGDLSSTSDEANGIAGFGEVSIDPTTETGYTLAIGTVKQLNEAKSTPGNEVYDVIATSTFDIKTEGNPAKQVLYVNASTPLPPGKYIVEVTGKKGSDEATTKEITIVVAEAELDASKIKWEEKNKLNDKLTSVGGQINTTTKINSKILEKEYSYKNGVYGTFYVNVANLNDTLLDGATIEYSLSTDSVSGVITVASNGLVTINKASKTNPLDDVFVLATISKDGYKDLEVKLPIQINKATSDFQFIKTDGTQYPLVDATGKDTTKYKPLDLVYATGTDALIDVFTQSAPTGTDVTFEIKYNGTSSAPDKNDVLEFADAGLTANADTDNPKTCVIKDAYYSTNRLTQCQAMIENALKDQAADRNMVVLYASIQATDNYNAMKIEIPINVLQAENSDWDFVRNEITVQSNTDGSFTPTFITKDATHPNIGNGKITLLLKKSGSQQETPNIQLDLLEYDINDPEYTNGYRTFKYNIIVPELGPNDVETYHVYAKKEKDRNWKASGEKELTVHILREGTSQFQVTVLPYPTAGGPPAQKITYGDDYFKVIASSADDDTDTAETYKYTIDPTATDYLSSYTGNGEADEFKSLKAGTNVKLNIERTAGNGTIMTGSTWVTIAKRPIKLKVDDVTKKSGMLVDVSDYQFTSTSESFLAQDIAKIKTTFSCEDTNGDDVSTLLDGIRMKHDKLPINATIEPLDPMDDLLDNYEILHLDGITSGIENGKLIVTEDESLNTWYNVKPGKINSTTDTVLGMNGWYNGPVDVEILPIAGSYDQISLDDKVGPWSTTSVTTSDEGDNKHNIYFRKSTNPDEGAITKAIEETIKIDTVAPEIVDIKATLTHTDAFSKLINTITFGMFMKPGEEVTINTKDVQANPAIAVSTTNSITDGITYNVYIIDENGNRDKQIVTNDKIDTDASGTGVFTLADPGVYEVCAIVEDQATNASLETCEKLLVKKIDIDVDGDGTNDYLDPDKDGCPDLDIVLKDAKGDFYKLNVDRDKDGIPDMNIDSNGDGIAEINVDTDKDGKPDLNLVILSTWEPAYCVPDQSDEYCTMKGIEPVINVDTGTDGIPDINIDTNGDFEPDFNVTRPGETKPYLNIGKVHEKWEPNKNDCKKDEFTYDTAVDGKPLVNVDSDTDGRPDINVDTNNDGKPDINIDINGDGIPDLEIDGDGDGEPDFNLDADANGNPTKNVIKISEWVPNKDGSKNGVDFDTMDSLRAKDTLVDDDSGIQIQKPGGSFLPNFSIKVDNIKDTISSEDKGKIEEYVKGDNEIKDVYDVKLSDGTTTVQPDGSVKVRIPLRNDLKDTDSIKVVVEQKDGTYKEVNATIKDGYIVYETDYLGKVGIIAAKVNGEDPVPDDKSDVTVPDLKPNTGGSTPDTSVKGNYTSGFGGAGTGDYTDKGMLMVGGILSMTTLFFLTYKRRKEE